MCVSSFFFVSVCVYALCCTANIFSSAQHWAHCIYLYRYTYILLAALFEFKICRLLLFGWHLKLDIYFSCALFQDQRRFAWVRKRKKASKSQKFSTWIHIVCTKQIRQHQAMEPETQNMAFVPFLLIAVKHVKFNPWPNQQKRQKMRLAHVPSYSKMSTFVHFSIPIFRENPRYLFAFFFQLKLSLHHFRFLCAKIYYLHFVFCLIQCQISNNT